MSNSNVVRTAMASVLQTGQYIGKSLKVFKNTTLNQKLGINAEVDPADSDRPSVKYVAIGNGGHNFIVGSNNRVKWKAVHHTPRHTALYNQLPFVLRTPANDLTATERLKYRLRRLETYNGITYVAYYLRVLDFSTTEINLELRTVKDGVTTATEYTPTLEDLNPTPPVLVSGEAVLTTADYIASTAKVPFTLSEEEVREFVEACKIIEGEEGFAVISEVATISGVDKAVLGDFNGVQQTYTDAIYAQITSFVSTGWVMDYQTNGIELMLDVGNVEPMLTTVSV